MFQSLALLFKIGIFYIEEVLAGTLNSKRAFTGFGYAEIFTSIFLKSVLSEFLKINKNFPEKGYLKLTAIGNLFEELSTAYEESSIFY